MWLAPPRRSSVPLRRTCEWLSTSSCPQASHHQLQIRRLDALAAGWHGFARGDTAFSCAAERNPPGGDLLEHRVGFIANNGLYSYASTQTLDLFYSLAVLLALAAVWPVYRRFGLPFAVFILITIVPPMSAGGLLSMGRVTSVLFPVFLWMGAAVPARHRVAWTCLFGVLQGFVAVMFFTWRPLY